MSSNEIKIKYIICNGNRCIEIPESDKYEYLGKGNGWKIVRVITSER